MLQLERMANILKREALFKYEIRMIEVCKLERAAENGDVKAEGNLFKQFKRVVRESGVLDSKH